MATTKIYTLSLHDALPICVQPGLVRERGLDDVRLLGVRRPVEEIVGEVRGLGQLREALGGQRVAPELEMQPGDDRDRKSTRLNSSHANISYAVFCLKKKNA